MASLGKYAGTLLPRKEHAELTQKCTAAGITLSDHVRDCLALGDRLLEVRKELRSDESPPVRKKRYGLHRIPD